MVTIIGDPDGVPESGVRPRPVRGLRWLVEQYGPIYVSQPHARLTFGEDGSYDCQLIEPQSYAEILPGVDPAALLGPVHEPVGWNPRDAAGDEEC